MKTKQQWDRLSHKAESAEGKQARRAAERERQAQRAAARAAKRAFLSSI